MVLLEVFPIPSLPLTLFHLAFISPIASYTYLETHKPAAMCRLPNYSNLQFGHMVAYIVFMEEGPLMISAIITIINTSNTFEMLGTGGIGHGWGQCIPLNICGHSASSPL
jgi:hypothetical protein